MGTLMDIVQILSPHTFVQVPSVVACDGDHFEAFSQIHFERFPKVTACHLESFPKVPLSEGLQLFVGNPFTGSGNDTTAVLVNFPCCERPPMQSSAMLSDGK